MLKVEIPIVLVIGYCTVASAHLPQPGWFTRLGIDEQLDFISLFIRVFEFHIGLVILVVGCLAAAFRWWRLFAAALRLFCTRWVLLLCPICRVTPPQ